MENYLETVMALQKLIQSERSLMVGIIPLQHQHRVFEIIIKESMDSIVQDGEVCTNIYYGVPDFDFLFQRHCQYSFLFQNIAARAKKCINRHDFAAVLVIFPILKHLLNMKPEFDKTFQGCDVNVQIKYTSILNTLHLTVRDLNCHKLAQNTTRHTLLTFTMHFFFF